jgi:hypothetical protein
MAFTVGEIFSELMITKATSERSAMCGNQTQRLAAET